MTKVQKQKIGEIYLNVNILLLQLGKSLYKKKKKKDKIAEIGLRNV